MRGVGGEVILDALVVADVNEDALEHPHTAALCHWHKHAALHHVLKQAHRFQTYRLAAGIWTRYDEQTLTGSQFDVEVSSMSSGTTFLSCFLSACCNKGWTA